MMATPQAASRQDDAPPRLISMGGIAGVFGVRGWVKVRSHTAPPENLFDYPVWWLKSATGWQPRRLMEGRIQGNRLVARLEGCDDRDLAATLVGQEVAVPRAELPAAGADEFYWADLEGLRVENLQGVALGRVDHLFETGSNDVMVVRGGRERLIPFTEQAVVQVGLAEGRILVDWDPDF